MCSELGLPGVRIVIRAAGLERRLVLEVRLEVWRPSFVFVRFRWWWSDAFGLIAGERVLFGKISKLSTASRA
jgi:hypothetical protein